MCKVYQLLKRLYKKRPKYTGLLFMIQCMQLSDFLFKVYDIIPSPILFDASGLMTKPDKLVFIRELESQHLVKENYPL